MMTFEELYESYAADVYRFAYWLSGNRAEAEDMTSETFIRAWAKKVAFRTETLKAYLFTIARNIYLAHQRKRRRQVALDDTHPDPAPGPEKRLESRGELVRVRRVLQTCPEIDRAAFLMRVQHELPYAEIARVLEISLAAAKVKVHRVRKKLIMHQAGKEDA
jgi:RNA polymerase sigma-70 factor (ECF subfamily)